MLQLSCVYISSEIDDKPALSESTTIIGTVAGSDVRTDTGEIR
jgi:hypothetical protein